MYEDLLERNKLQISELNTLTEEQDRHIVELEKENAKLKKELRKQAVSTVEWENTSVLDRPLFVHAYITGAKLRENRIEELEKENAELRNIAEFQQHSNMSRYFENKQLKDENAELKKQCSILADCNTCHSTCKNENIEMKKQLTKAKGIIRDLLQVLPKENIEGVYEVTEAAEQFLKENT